VCCTHAVKLALHLKEKNPACRVAVLYRDMRTYGEREILYHKARKLGVLFVRYEVTAKPRVSVKDGGLRVLVRDHVLDLDLEFRPDVLALAAALAPPDTDRLSRMFKVSTDAHGWFQEAHVKLRPVDFATDGVFLAGMAHGPKALDESLAQAQAAAVRAAQVLSRPEMTLSGITALVDEAKCVGCKMCVTVCPFKAISLNAKNLAEVNEAMCKGCGLCTGSCRSSAIALRGFTDQDLMAQIGAMFADEEARP
jgi:heterodisulfide reductase subunit A